MIATCHRERHRPNGAIATPQRGRRLEASHGFTLIELMIVVVIIGILASLAIPRFMAAAVRAKQSEAKQILKQIYVQEHAYRQFYERYALPVGVADKNNPMALSPIAIEIMGAARYEYTITSVDNGITKFVAQATVANPGLDDDPAPDTWTIDDKGNLVAVSNDVTD